MKIVNIVLLFFLSACDNVSVISDHSKAGICSLMIDSSRYTLDQLNTINVRLTMGNPAAIMEEDKKQIYLNEVARRTVKDWNASSNSCKNTCEIHSTECTQLFDKAVNNCFISGFCYEGSHIRK